MVEHEFHRLAHVAAPRVGGTRVIAEVRALEEAAHDLGDREHAGDVALGLGDRQHAAEVVAEPAREQLVELFIALGGIGPRAVKLARVAHHREERAAV